MGVSTSSFLGLSWAQVKDLERLYAESILTWPDGTLTALLWDFAVDETRLVYWVERFGAMPPEGTTESALIALL